VQVNATNVLALRKDLESIWYRRRDHCCTCAILTRGHYTRPHYQTHITAMSIAQPRGGAPKRSSTVLVSPLTPHCTPFGHRIRLSLSCPTKLACCPRLTRAANRSPIRAMLLPHRTVPRPNAKALVASSPLTTSCSMPQISRPRSVGQCLACVLPTTPARHLENIP
jgi:hypothetical protein